MRNLGLDLYSSQLVHPREEEDDRDAEAVQRVRSSKVGMA